MAELQVADFNDEPIVNARFDDSVEYLKAFAYFLHHEQVRMYFVFLGTRIFGHGRLHFKVEAVILSLTSSNHRELHADRLALRLLGADTPVRLPIGVTRLGLRKMFANRLPCISK
jgi:hypothetical protein